VQNVVNNFLLDYPPTLARLLVNRRKSAQEVQEISAQGAAAVQALRTQVCSEQLFKKINTNFRLLVSTTC
jgi:hypothetical protein